MNFITFKYLTEHRIKPVPVKQNSVLAWHSIANFIEASLVIPGLLASTES